MWKEYLIIILIFLAVWAGGVFLTIVTGLNKAKSSPIQETTQSQALREEQHHIATEAKKDTEKLMDDYEEQMKWFRYQEGKPRSDYRY
ncbi:MAG: hypothetical protein ABIJ41_00105 [Candidatus Omnitrophota bacterium]